MAATLRSSIRERLSSGELATLVRVAAAGDRSSWAELVREFDGLLWAVARAHRLREADAADVVQTTWVKLLEHLGSLNDPGRVGGWLATTARRECLGVLRRAQRDVLYGDDAPDYESPHATPDQVMLLSERDEALRQAFSRLRLSDQTLLRLALAEPRPSYEEISAALDMPMGSIGPTRARALGRLRREVVKEDPLIGIDC
jgi:RNA polymerase sigma factor (sigma-70 family)